MKEITTNILTVFILIFGIVTAIFVDIFSIFKLHTKTGIELTFIIIIIISIFVCALILTLLLIDTIRILLQNRKNKRIKRRK